MQTHSKSLNRKIKMVTFLKKYYSLNTKQVERSFSPKKQTEREILQYQPFSPGWKKSDIWHAHDRKTRLILYLSIFLSPELKPDLSAHWPILPQYLPLDRETVFGLRSAENNAKNGNLALLACQPVSSCKVSHRMGMGMARWTDLVVVDRAYRGETIRVA